MDSLQNESTIHRPHHPYPHHNRFDSHPQQSRRSSDSFRGWDVFETTIRGKDEPDLVMYDKVIKIIKLIVLMVTSTIVLISSLISTSVFLLMVSMIGYHKLTVCNLRLPSLASDRRYYISLSPENSDERNSVNTDKIVWNWALFFCLIFPELLTMLRGLRSIFSSASTWPTLKAFTVIFIMETLRALGIGLLTWYILPSMNSLFSLMITSSFAIIPSFLMLISRDGQLVERKDFLIINWISFVIQLIALAGWPLICYFFQDSTQIIKLSLLPIVLIMISLGWTENYLPNQCYWFNLSSLTEISESLSTSRYLIYLLIAPWKIIIWLLLMILVNHYENNLSSQQLFEGFNFLTKSHQVLIKEDSDIGTSTTIQSTLISINLMIIQIISSLITYVVGKFTCKICVQTSSFALPLSLSSPLLVSLTILWCHIKTKFTCLIYNYFTFLPGYIFWFCPNYTFIENWKFMIVVSFWFLTYLTRIWSTLHIWSPPRERASRTEKLFVSPLYCSAFVDTYLAYNRRREDQHAIINEAPVGNQIGGSTSATGGLVDFTEIELSDHVIHDSDRITRIYACVTMWHETADEMLQTVKSVIRMDEDQSARENAQKYLKVVDPDYYQFETHIMFDDAFQLSDNEEDEMVINPYVQQFIGVVNEAVSAVHKTHLKLRPPTKIPTPYGGRLIWTLPGKTKLIVHLKDKAKIRHKKRWSQVMYMYYLLGHLLMDSNLHINRKAVRGENTYLLTLDGDIDFRPPAVLLLIDLMKKDSNLGAACGRIHPVGTGIMVWYQTFEYAVSHWLQKAAEHVYGCVLCSPGAYSLFRARSLMSPNVLKTYAAESKEPVDYIQHDQGEDRWLCTLLLQSGYRVEYNAASDAYTHCPESFNEFYIQRRRWGPSTMANILDLLKDYKNIVTVNRSISYWYIAYQAFLLLSTIIGPGTILLMLVGAVNAVFGLDNTRSLIVNLVPVLLFIIICFVAKNDFQLFVAQILSAAYVFLMLAVLIGTAIQIKDEPFSPSTLFFVIMIVTFVMASLLHPREISCFFSFPLYLLCIPSMYLLLTLYSLINLHVVSWGTREGPAQAKKTSDISKPKSGQTDEQKSYLFHFLNLLENRKSQEANLSFSFGNIFRCMLCTHDTSTADNIQLVRVEEAIRDLSTKVNSIAIPGRQRRTSELSRVTEEGSVVETILEVDENEMNDPTEAGVEPKIIRDDLKNPYWMEDSILKDSPVLFLSNHETNFWKELLAKYLYPLDKNLEKEAKVAAGLKDLRDKVMFGILMLNAIFVLTIFLLQLNRDKLSITLPFSFDLTSPETVSEDDYIDDAVEEVKSNNKLEPVGAAFIFTFSILLIIQVIGMFKHRLSTFSHILAFVQIDFFNRKKENAFDLDFIEKNAVEIAKDLQCLRGLDDENNENTVNPTDGGTSPTNGDPGSNNKSSLSVDVKNKATLERKNTIYNLERKKRDRTLTLDVAFRKRFLSLSTRDKDGLQRFGGNLRRRQAIQALERHRDRLLTASTRTIEPFASRSTTPNYQPYNPSSFQRYQENNVNYAVISRSRLTNLRSLGYLNRAYQTESSSDDHPTKLFYPNV